MSAVSTSLRDRAGRLQSILDGLPPRVVLAVVLLSALLVRGSLLLVYHCSCLISLGSIIVGINSGKNLSFCNTVAFFYIQLNYFAGNIRTYFYFHFRINFAASRYGFNDGSFSCLFRSYIHSFFFVACN